MNENYLTLLSKVLALSEKDKITFFTDLARHITEESRYLLLIHIFSQFDKRTLNDALQVVKTKSMLDKLSAKLDENHVSIPLLESLSSELKELNAINNNYAES